MSYSLGFKMLQMGEVRRKQSNLWSLSAPVMRQIRDEIGETVVLSIRRGDLRIQIDAAEGLHSLRRIADPGLHAPLYAGAASRVLLAGMSEPDINAYLRRTPLKQIQKNTMTSVDLLLAELAVILAQGYAESSNEVLEGGAALAAPIRNMSGATVGVLDIITPESRYSPEHREKALRLLLEGVASISRRAGAGS
jgi:DNA-binding IclR family transcriptional regulator